MPAALRVLSTVRTCHMSRKFVPTMAAIGYSKLMMRKRMMTPLACRPRGSALTFREGSPSSSAGLSCKYLGWDNGGLGTRATRCEPYTSGFMLQWLWDKTPEKPTNPSPPARNVWEADDQRTVGARHADRGGPQRSTRMRVMAALAVAKSPYGRSTRQREAVSCSRAHSWTLKRRVGRRPSSRGAPGSSVGHP